MELKKNTKKELGWKRLDFFLIGLICSIGISLLAFSWKSYEKPISLLGNTIWEDEDSPLIVEIEEIKTKNEIKPKEEVLLDNFEEIETIMDNVEPIEEKFELDLNFNFDEYQMYRTSDEIIETDEIIDMVDVSEFAHFIDGGELGFSKYLQTNTKYPDLAAEIGIQGLVIICFVINKDDSICDITFHNEEIGFGLEEEVARVIMSTSGMWKPAKQRDKEVAMRYRLPYRFQLN